MPAKLFTGSGGFRVVNRKFMTCWRLIVFFNPALSAGTTFLAFP